MSKNSNAAIGERASRNRYQLDVIEYLQEENRVLKKRLGGRRIRLTEIAGRGADQI